MILKTATAYSRKFMMISSTDHISGKTGLGSGVTVKLSKGPNAAGTTAAGTVSELDSTNLPGMYQIALTTADTSTSGDLGFACTGTGADPTNFVDQVQGQVFTDLVLNASGRAMIANNLQQNTALTFLPFPMTNSAGQLLPGLTPTVTRALSVGGFAAAASTVAEIGGSGASGVYALNVNASDLNSVAVAFFITATGANTVVLPLVPTP